MGYNSPGRHFREGRYQTTVKGGKNETLDAEFQLPTPHRRQSSQRSSHYGNSYFYSTELISVTDSSSPTQWLFALKSLHPIVSLLICIDNLSTDSFIVVFFNWLSTVFTWVYDARRQSLTCIFLSKLNQHTKLGRLNTWDRKMPPQNY